MNFMQQVLELVQACPHPYGATSDYVEAQTGEEFGRVSRALQKLRGKTLIFSTRGYGESHYFTSQEALEAAAQAVSDHAATKRQAAKEAEKAYQSARFRTEEYRAKAREYARQRYEKGYRSPERKEPKPPKVVEYAPAVQIKKPAPGGPARMPGEPVFTSETKITIAPPPPARMWKSNTHSIL